MATKAKKTATTAKKSPTAKSRPTRAAAKIKPEKTAVVKQEPETAEVTQAAQADKNTVGPRAFKIHKTTLFIALAIILLGALLYFGRGLLVAAVVNGQPISRLEIVSEAEKASGKQVLDSAVRTVLVEQEARKQNITISDKELNDQIKDIEKNLTSQGQNIDQMLKLQGMTRADLQRIVRLDLLVTKMVGGSIKITEADVDKYIEENKEFLPKDKKEADLRKEAREQLKKSQLPQKAQEWFAELEKKSNITKFVNY